MNKKKKILLSASIVGILLVYLAYMSFGSMATNYMTVSELIASKTDKISNVNGTIVNGSSSYLPTKLELSFKLSDGVSTIDVVYIGNKPEGFKEGIEAVATGQYIDGVFKAQRLLLKCPSKYEEESAASLNKSLSPSQ